MNTRPTLKQVLIIEAKTLKGVAIPKKTFIRKIVEKYPQFSTGYISMYLNKCVVNNPSRKVWGQAIDLFAETEKGYLISNEKYRAKFPIVPEDKEYIKGKIVASQRAKRELFDAYMAGVSFQS